MYTIFIVATKNNNTWTMYTIFIVAIQKKKEKDNIGQCTIRYIKGERRETEHAGGRHACLGEKAKNLR